MATFAIWLEVQRESAVDPSGVILSRALVAIRLDDHRNVLRQ